MDQTWSFLSPSCQTTRGNTSRNASKVRKQIYSHGIGTTKHFSLGGANVSVFHNILVKHTVISLVFAGVIGCWELKSTVERAAAVHHAHNSLKGQWARAATTVPEQARA